jgi:hypothetical protein
MQLRRSRLAVQLNVGNRRASKVVMERYEGPWRSPLKPTTPRWVKTRKSPSARGTSGCLPERTIPVPLSSTSCPFITQPCEQSPKRGNNLIALFRSSLSNPLPGRAKEIRCFPDGDKQAAVVDGIYPRDHSAHLKAGSSAWSKCKLCRIAHEELLHRDRLKDDGTV